VDKLAARIKQVLAEQDGHWGVAVRNHITDELIYINEDELFSAASIIKIPIMMEAYHQAQQGAVSLDDVLVLNAKDVVGGCGILQGMHPGMQLTVRDTIVLMITVSDNTATNMMIELVGIEAVNQRMIELGAEKSILRRKLMMPELARKGIKNELTAKDVLIFLDTLANGTYISKNACEDMMDILKLQQLNHKIPLLLPQNVTVAHKTGEDDKITHNAGVMYYKEGSLSLCVLSQEVSDTVKGHYAIARMARAAYEEILSKR
jgi:beta-lactamase class A